jgi:hypothetical protein
MARLVLINGKLGPEHYRAICDEIGARLGFMVRPEKDFPPRIAELLNQLAALDCEAPSIAPALSDLTDPAFMDVA